MKKLKTKIIIIYLVLAIIILGLPYLMDKLIIGNNIKSNINNSDWVSFLGSYAGSLIGGTFTLIALYTTVSQTREIQEENKNIQRDIIELEKQDRLKNSRTFLSDAILNSDYELKKYSEVLKNSKVIINKEFEYMENLLIEGSLEYFKMHTSTMNGETEIVNINHLNSKIDDLKEYGMYTFRNIKNVGNNTMYDVNIIIKGNWININTKEKTDGCLSFDLDYIDSRESIILPLFKLSKDLDIIQFKPMKMEVTYYTGLVGLVEKTNINFEYIDKQRKIKKTLDVEEVNLDGGNYSNSYSKYKYLI